MKRKKRKWTYRDAPKEARDMEKKLIPLLSRDWYLRGWQVSDLLASSSNYSGMSPFQEKLIKLGIEEVDIGHYRCDGEKYLLVKLGWPVGNHRVLRVPMELAMKVLTLGFFPLDTEA